MQWIELKTPDDAAKIKKASLEVPGSVYVIFKNSTRCGSSRFAKNTFESEWTPDLPVYLVIVIEHREASNAIAQIYGIRHESPQVLVIRNGDCIYHNSHSAIDAGEVLKYTSSEPLR